MLHVPLLQSAEASDARSAARDVECLSVKCGIHHHATRSGADTAPGRSLLPRLHGLERLICAMIAGSAPDACISLAILAPISTPIIPTAQRIGGGFLNAPETLERSKTPFERLFWAIKTLAASSVLKSRHARRVLPQVLQQNALTFPQGSRMRG